MIIRLALLSWLTVVGSASTAVMDQSGAMRLQALSDDSLTTSQGVLTIVASPDTPSTLVSDVSDILSVTAAEVPQLICRGATLQGTSEAERQSLAVCSLIATSIVVDGITAGDCEGGIANSRHGRTLTALFRSRVKLASSTGKLQTLILAIKDASDVDSDKVLADVASLYKAVATEKKGAPSLEEVYEVKIASAADGEKLVSEASESAKENRQDEAETLSSAISSALQTVKESGVGAAGLDTPLVAHAFTTVGNTYSRQIRTVRAKVAAWKSRTARGLIVDKFGQEAEALRKRVLGTFDSETLSSAGLPLVAKYRLEMRSSLQSMLDSGIEEVFVAQVSNLEKSTIKRFEAQLLRSLNDPVESAKEANAATLRNEAFAFETIMDEIEVPALGMSKAKAVRDMASKLNDSLMSFSDGPAAKVKRLQKVRNTVSKNKKPGQRGFDIGLDLVAVLRPDGYGSLQGFAGYQLGGNSITFGIHNDADDPQTIAQFGGVRPPLLRVQPKLRLDVEL